MTGFWNDARLAMRGLFRARGFAAITIGTLALGIGAVTAIFTVVNGVLLKPLPFENPDELVGVWHTAPAAMLARRGSARRAAGRGLRGRQRRRAAGSRAARRS